MWTVCGLNGALPLSAAGRCEKERGSKGRKEVLQRVVLSMRSVVPAEMTHRNVLQANHCLDIRFSDEALGPEMFDNLSLTVY